MYFLNTLQIILLIGYLCQPAYAQQKEISGRLVDEQGNEIAFAAVSLIQLTDSAVIKSSLADSAGAFYFRGIKPEVSYFIKISAMGFKPYRSKPFVHQDTGLNYLLGDIRLVSDDFLLQEVVISGAPPLVEQQLDKVILNVENSVLAAGSNVLELLGKTPGVTAGDDGTVSLKGRNGTLVMLNGKPTYLSDLQLANLLRGMSAANVQRIEVMNNPSARYDASGNGGIINIVLKKPIKGGINGAVSVNGGTGRGAILGGTASLNYRSEKWNMYGSYDQYYRNSKSFDDIMRYYYGSEGVASGRAKQLSNQHTIIEPRLRSNNFRVGIDLFLNERNTLGFLVNGGLGKYPTRQPTRNTLSALPQQNLIWQANTLTEGKERWEDFLYNINFEHQFDTDGHMLTADLDYVSHYDRMDQQLDTRYIVEQGAVQRPRAVRIGDIPSNNDIYVGKIDYTLPYATGGKLEAGWKSSYVETENNIKYDTLSNEGYVYDASTSNHFIYKEQIHAGYANLKNSWGAFTLQLGLRGEYTATKGEQITSDSSFTRNYFKLFPSGFLAVNVSEKHKLQAGYSRRIQRPSYWDLNPFRVYVDPFSYYEGNAQLLPAFVNSFEIGYSYRSFIHVALNYNESTDVVNSLVGLLANTNITYEKPANLGAHTNYGVSVTTTTAITSWWTGTQFVNLYRNKYTIQSKQEDVKRAGNTLTFNSQNMFKLGNGWRAELSGFYLSGLVTGVSKLKAYHLLSAGIQKDLLGDQANIKLMVNDIFRGNRFKQEQIYGDVAIYSLRNADSRSAILSFTYRFGKENNAGRKRNTGSEDLKNRIK